MDARIAPARLATAAPLLRGDPLHVPDEPSLSSPSRAALVTWRAFFECGLALEDLLGVELEESTGLTFRWYDVLVHLQEAGPGGMPMTALADAILTSKSGLTRVIDKMEAAGLVVRNRPADNRRVVIVSLTGSGTESVEHARLIHRDGIRRHFAEHLTPDELDALGETLEKLTAHVRPLRPGRVAPG